MAQPDLWDYDKIQFARLLAEAEDDEEDDEDEEYSNVYEDCYYNDSAVCRGGLWMCETCKQYYCTEHWHETDQGHNVECVACERERKERDRAAAGR